MPAGRRVERVVLCLAETLVQAEGHAPLGHGRDSVPLVARAGGIVADCVDETRRPPVVVELPGAVRVQIPPGCDASTIQAVLQAAAALRPGGLASC